MHLVEAGRGQLEAWDGRVERSWNGTIFHRRAFLAYHGDRFSGRERFLMAMDGNAPVAQIALTIDDAPGRLAARSPYGGSYGGFVLLEPMGFGKCRELVQALRDFLVAESVEEFTLTPPIACCSAEPSDVMAFCLITAGFHSVNRDLSSVVRLGGEASIARMVTSRARNMARKAENRGVTIRRGNLSDFWIVMDKTFERHNAKPTHTKAEFEYLIESFPSLVYVDVAYDKSGVPLAGIGYMTANRQVNSSFYFCQDPERRDEQGLSLLVLRALEESEQAGFTWFDFGTSTINMQPRDTLFRFKESFSRTAVFRETFRWQPS